MNRPQHAQGRLQNTERPFIKTSRHHWITVDEYKLRIFKMTFSTLGLYNCICIKVWFCNLPMQCEWTSKSYLGLVAYMYNQSIWFDMHQTNGYKFKETICVNYDECIYYTKLYCCTNRTSFKARVNETSNNFQSIVIISTLNHLKNIIIRRLLISKVAHMYTES